MQKRYPFKFLDAYTRDDQDIFFGREEEVAQLYEMVFQTDLILVYGASGTGKTSLIQCGLAGKFESHDWLDLFIRRGHNLNDSFAKALEAAGGVLATEEDLDWLDQDWNADTTEVSTTQLSPLARQLKAIYLKHFKPIYLIFDQFEELYILGDKAEQQQFIETVQELLLVEQPVKLIISIREEYLGYLYEFEKQVPELLRKKLRVEPMNLDKVKSVIQNIGSAPRSLVGLQVEEGEAIAEGIFEKIRGQEQKLSIPLPYLQVFLDKFYLTVTNDEQRQQAAIFSLAALGKMKDIDNVLRDFLDEQVIATAQDLEEQPDTVWKILSPFVTLEGTKEPLSLTDLQQRFKEFSPSLIANALQDFVNSRILRYTEEEGLYEIAHDSLALQIHDKRSNEEIAILEIQRLIKSQMALKENVRAFLPADQLELVDLYADKLILREEEQAYIEASRKEVERKNSARRNRIILILGASILAFAILAVSAFFFWRGLRDTRSALDTIQRNQKIKVAEELQIYGDNYQDLGKLQEAKEVYQAALDSLGVENVDLNLYKVLEGKIKRTEN